MKISNGVNLEILDRKRKKLLPQLAFLKKYSFYLAGGTALALQIGHRTSLDFDFYTEKKFDSRKLRQDFDRRFKKIQEIYIAEDTLEVRVEGIRVSFFRYPYKLIKPRLSIKEVNLASPEDIAAMKIIAISDRGTKRDFIDIYFLLKKFSLKDILWFVKKKYPNFNIYVGLQGLTYFVDTEKKQQRKLYLIHSVVSWNKIKKFLIEEVKKYQEKWLK